MEQKIPFHPYLTPEQGQLLERSLHRVSYKKGSTIHRHGDNCVGFIFVHSGRVAFSILSEEGREITLFRAEPGDTCVLSAACVFQVIELESQLTAETDAEVSILPAAVLSQLMAENSDVERVAYKLATRRFADTIQVMQRVVFCSLEKRLALFLQEECRRRKSNTFSATHEQIARYIGSSREVVTRTLNQFAGRGIVSLGRGTVTVLDEDALEDATC